MGMWAVAISAVKTCEEPGKDSNAVTSTQFHSMVAWGSWRGQLRGCWG